MTSRGLISVVLVMAMAVPCSRCKTRPAVADVGLCHIDIVFLSRQATNAYDDVRRRRRPSDEDDHVRLAISYVESGHARHVAPHIGCPFCILPA